MKDPDEKSSRPAELEIHSKATVMTVAPTLESAYVPDAKPSCGGARAQLEYRLTVGSAPRGYTHPWDQRRRLGAPGFW